MAGTTAGPKQGHTCALMSLITGPKNRGDPTTRASGLVAVSNALSWFRLG